MKKIDDYINGLTKEEILTAYTQEYMPFKKTGICPDGVLRNIAKLFNEISGSYDLRFAERCLLEKMAENYYLEFIHQ